MPSSSADSWSNDLFEEEQKASIKSKSYEPFRSDCAVCCFCEVGRSYTRKFALASLPDIPLAGCRIANVYKACKKSTQRAAERVKRNAAILIADLDTRRRRA